MFNWSENITLPKLGDVINSSDTPPNILQSLTYLWVYYLGGWFFAGLIGAIGAALYIKYNNTVVPVVFFIISIILLGGTGGVFFEESGGIPSASYFVYIIGIIAAYVFGTLLYMLFVGKEG